MSAQIVYRILNADGVPCNGRHGDPDDNALYTNPVRADRAIRILNDPEYAPRAPQPRGRPYRRDTGRIAWGNPL
jgi:hypothetical protein